MKVGISWSGNHRVVEDAELAAFVDCRREYECRDASMINDGYSLQVSREMGSTEDVLDEALDMIYRLGRVFGIQYRSRIGPGVGRTIEHTLLLTIIMPNERPSDHTRIRKIAGPFKWKLSSLLHLSRAPAQSSIDIGSSSDNSAK